MISAAVGGAVGSVMSLKISASWMMACIVSVFSGASGLAGVGCWSAVVKSRAAAVARSVADALGILMPCPGNQVRVSVYLEDFVSFTQTLKSL